MYKTKSPVLFLIFNRPEATQRVFEKIREVKPDVLYIAADGPRSEKIGEHEICQATRNSIVVDWDCEVHTLYREKNLGCKNAVSGGIKWFFNHVTEGIVLEDDCLPDTSFFYYCDTLLEKYRFDSRIGHISGTNMSINRRFGDASYYFTKFTNVWGWASWNRVWKDYDENLTLLDDFISGDMFKNVFPDEDMAKAFINALTMTQSGALNTWDYQYAFLNFWNNRLSLSSNYNLISNIGYNNQGTHTADANHKYANVPLESVQEITHPKFVLPSLDADRYVFNLERRTFKDRLISKLARLKMSL